MDQTQFSVQTLVLAGLKAVGGLLYQINDPQQLRRRELPRQGCCLCRSTGAGDHAKTRIGGRFDDQHISCQSRQLFQHGRSVLALTVKL